MPCSHAERELTRSIAPLGKLRPNTVMPFPAHVLLLLHAGLGSPVGPDVLSVTQPGCPLSACWAWLFVFPTLPGPYSHPECSRLGSGPHCQLSQYTCLSLPLPACGLWGSGSDVVPGVRCACCALATSLNVHVQLLRRACTVTGRAVTVLTSAQSSARHVADTGSSCWVNIQASPSSAEVKIRETRI